MNRTTDRSVFDRHEMIAQVARNVMDRLVQEPSKLFHHLTDLCEHSPRHGAELIMCLAAWIDLDTPDEILAMRAQQKAAIAQWQKGLTS